MPALFSGFFVDTVFPDQKKGISENTGCGPEIDPVLGVGAQQPVWWGRGHPARDLKAGPNETL